MHTVLRRPILIAAAVCCALASACKKQDTAAEQSQAEVVRYTTRGQVAEVPAAGDPRKAFRVRHEAIPEYRRVDGTLGMNTMTMEFPLAEGVSLEGLEVGDVVRLTFEVEYDPGFAKLRGYKAVEVAELPADTELDFSPLPKPE